LWRKAFDEVDKRVAGPVEAGAHSDLFNDLVSLQWKLARRAQRGVEKRTRRLLHAVNLPTATDVRRLSEQVASLERQVRNLTRELEDRSRPARVSRANGSMAAADGRLSPSAPKGSSPLERPGGSRA